MPHQGVTFHLFLYYYASLCSGPHLHKHNPVQQQSSIWHLFSAVANLNIFGYLTNHH